MRIWSRPLGPFATNCYIVADPDGPAAWVIDPGTPDPWVSETLSQVGLTVEAIVLTHGHVDHIGGVEQVKGETGAPVWIHPADQPMLGDPRKNGGAFFGMLVRAPEPDRLLAEGDRLRLGSLEFQVLHTPGHTPGGISFYTPGHVIAGDTLFAGSIGRSDLPGGNFEQLITSIRTKLLVLPPETMVYPGHGPTTSIGDEREYNPFV